MSQPYLTATRIHLLIAALFGAAGVILQAAGTHGGSANATTAGTFLLFHAPVLMAVTALRRTGLMPMGAAAIAASLLALGVALFSADLALRGLVGMPLFPFAAPLGGGLMILGWIALAIVTLLPDRAG